MLYTAQMEKTAGTDSEMLRKGADRDMEKNCRRFTAEELEIAKSTDEDPILPGQ